MPHTAVNRRVAIAWRALHVFSQASDYPVHSVIDFSGATRVSRTINRVPQIRNLFESERDVARPVDRY